MYKVNDIETPQNRKTGNTAIIINILELFMCINIYDMSKST